MPLVRIDLLKGRTPAQRRAAADVVYDALLSIGVPPDDRFQVVTEHDRANFFFSESYLGISHPDEVIVIQITFNEGRSVDQKKTLYRAIADGLHQRLGARREDVFISLVEVRKENWSFGDGEAQYAS